jgi:hypothetical protein
MDDTEKLAQMMIRCGLATGHGDTIDDLIFELEKQIKNTSHAFSDARKQIEQLRNDNNRLACLAIDNAKDTGRALMYRKILQQIADEGSGHGQALAYAALKDKK